MVMTHEFTHATGDTSSKQTPWANHIAIHLNYTHVLEVRPDLTIEQARHVLGIAEETYDPEVGINYNVLRDIANLTYDNGGEADTIAITWHADDVLEVRPDLTREQARQVLKYAQETHNAEIGINWDVLRVDAEEIYPEGGEA
jgi:hypothetical protein